MGALVGVDPNHQVTGQAGDPVHVTGNAGPEVPLGLLIRLVGLTFLGYTLLTLLVGGFLWNQQHDARFKDQQAVTTRLAAHNEALTRRLNAEQIVQDRKIRVAVADLCANAELRDTVIANQSRAIAALLRQNPNPTPYVEALINASEDAIHTLEPKNEKDCPLPPGSP